VKLLEIVSLFLTSDYHLRALRSADSLAGAMQRSFTAANGLPEYRISPLIRRMIMAKGQQRKTKEAKKPKKQPAK